MGVGSCLPLILLNFLDPRIHEMTCGILPPLSKIEAAMSVATILMGDPSLSVPTRMELCIP